MLTLILLVGIYALCVFFDAWDVTRSGKFQYLRTFFNPLIGIGAYVMALGIISVRCFRSLPLRFPALVLSLFAATFVFATAGYEISKHFYQGACNPEKAEHDLIVIGCIVISVLVFVFDLAIYLTVYFNGGWYDRNNNGMD